MVENRWSVSTLFFRFVSFLLLYRKLYGLIFWDGGKQPVWYMRRLLLKKALDSEATHIFFLDTDVYFDDFDVIDRLLAYDKDMVSGVYYNVDGHPCSYKNGKSYYGKGLEKVDVCSMGACLIKREVIERVEYPSPTKMKVDADPEFCMRVGMAGFEIWQDFDLVGHHVMVADVKKDKVTTSNFQD